MADTQLLGKATLDRLATIEASLGFPVWRQTDGRTFGEGANARLAAAEAQLGFPVWRMTDGREWGQMANARLSAIEAQLGIGGLWTPASFGSNLVLDFTHLDSSHLFQDTACTTPITADGQTVKGIKDTTTGIIFTNSTGWVYHANSGHPYLAMDGTSKFASTTSFTFADATGQYAIWFTGQISGSPSVFADLLTDSSGHTLLAANSGNGLVSLNNRSASAQLATATSTGVAANTNAVYSGISTGTSGTSGNIEAFVNNVNTPGSGVVAWTGTPMTSTGFWLNPATTSAGSFSGLLIAKGDQTSNLANGNAYMGALHS